MTEMSVAAVERGLRLLCGTPDPVDDPGDRLTITPGGWLARVPDEMSATREALVVFEPSVLWGYLTFLWPTPTGIRSSWKAARVWQGHAGVRRVALRILAGDFGWEATPKRLAALIWESKSAWCDPPCPGLSSKPLRTIHALLKRDAFETRLAAVTIVRAKSVRS